MTPVSVHNSHSPIVTIYMFYKDMDEVKEQSSAMDDCDSGNVFMVVNMYPRHNAIGRS